MCGWGSWRDKLPLSWGVRGSLGALKQRSTQREGQPSAEVGRHPWLRELQVPGLLHYITQRFWGALGTPTTLTGGVGPQKGGPGPEGHDLGKERLGEEH
jgi:hypothetical protein